MGNFQNYFIYQVAIIQSKSKLFSSQRVLNIKNKGLVLGYQTLQLSLWNTVKYNLKNKIYSIIFLTNNIYLKCIGKFTVT